MQVINEVIKFGDNTLPETLRVRVARFGPVMNGASGGVDASGAMLALRWTTLSIHYDLLGAFLALDHAGLVNYGSPAQNFVMRMWTATSPTRRRY